MHIGQRAQFKCVSRSAANAVNHFNRRAHIVNKYLARFFGDSILSFRSLQARTGMLISGSMALQVLDQTVYPESDLDLYVELFNALEVANWLAGEGYTFAPNTKQKPFFMDVIMAEIVAKKSGPCRWEEITHHRRVSIIETMLEYKWRGLATVLSFVRPTSDGARSKVQVIIAEDSPVEVILQFHSSTFKYELVDETLTQCYSHSVCNEHHLLREHRLAVSLPDIHSTEVDDDCIRERRPE